MTLRTFLTVLRNRRWFVLTMVVLALAVSGAIGSFATRTYTATAALYFTVDSASSVDDLATGATFSQSQLTSYATLVLTPEVLQPVVDDLDIDGGLGALSGQLAVTAVSGTVILQVSATDTNAADAAEIANAVAEQTITAVEDLAPDVVSVEGETTGASAVSVKVVTPAVAPSAPSSPNVPLTLIAGGVLGLGLGVLLAVGRELLDNRVRTADDVGEITREPLLGTLGEESGRRRRVSVEVAPHSAQAEAYRQLRTNLSFLELGDGAEPGNTHRTISVTSSLAAEGKSTVAANLAATLAETSARVLLVDADLRRPTVASTLGLEGAVGLTTVLLGQADLDDVVQPWGTAGLHVLPAGALPPNPTELLGSVAMRRLLGELRASYDYVVIDSAPLLPVADSAVLAGLVDGTLVVVNATKTRRHQLTESLGNLARVDARVLGIVLNQVARNARTYGYYAAELPTAVGAQAPLPAPARTGSPSRSGRDALAASLRR